MKEKGTTKEVDEIQLPKFEINRVSLDDYYERMSAKLDISSEEILKIFNAHDEVFDECVKEAMSGEHPLSIIESPTFMSSFTAMNISLYYDDNTKDIRIIDGKRFGEQMVPSESIQKSVYTHSGMDSSRPATNEEIHEFFKTSVSGVTASSPEEEKYLKDFKDKLVNASILDDTYRENAKEHLRIAHMQGSF